MEIRFWVVQVAELDAKLGAYDFLEHDMELTFTLHIYHSGMQM